MAKAATKKSDMFDLDEALEGAKAPKVETKKKSDVPVLQVDKQIEEKAKKIRDKSGQVDTLEAEIAGLEAEIFKTVEKKRIELCKAGYVSAVKVPTSDGFSITFSWQDKYKAIPLEREEDIKGIMGKKYAEFMRKTLKISVKSDLTEDDLREIIKRLGGKEEFARFMQVERGLVPTRNYTLQFFSAFSDAIRAKLSLLIEQFKPAMKVK